MLANERLTDVAQWTCHNEWLLARPGSFSNLPAFLDLYGILILFGQLPFRNDIIIVGFHSHYFFPCISQIFPCLIQFWESYLRLKNCHLKGNDSTWSKAIFICTGSTSVFSGFVFPSSAAFLPFKSAIKSLFAAFSSRRSL